MTGGASHPLEGGVRLHIFDLSKRNSRVISKSSDLSYTPGEGFGQYRSLWYGEVCSFELFLFYWIVRIVGRSLGRHRVKDLPQQAGPSTY